MNTNNTLNILAVTTSYPVSGNSISGVFIQRLYEHFTEDSNITIVTPASTTPNNQSKLNSIKLICFRYAPWKLQTIAHKPGGLPTALKRNKLNSLLLIPFLTSLFFTTLRGARKADLIHAHWSLSGAVAGTVGWLTSTPVITTLHGSDIARAQDSIAYKWLLFLCIKLSQRIITVSESLENQLKLLFPWAEDGLTTISNGVEQSLLEIPPKNNKVNKLIHISTVCSLIPLKGVDIIIRAIAQYRGKEQLQLNIIGDGPEYSNLLELTKNMNILNQVHFSGMLPASAVAKLWATTDIFILASNREGRPSVVLESMAAAVPVIASDIEATRDLIQNEQNGLLFDLTNEQSLVEQIDKLASDPILRSSIGLAGRELILSKRLLWNETANQYRNLFKKLIRKG